ncbi:MAG: FecR domain-containing protein [Salinivirgaceae bacterium]|nr:FecR domain-containing protein [Salinivirgaceae bacterium]
MKKNSENISYNKLAKLFAESQFFQSDFDTSEANIQEIESCVNTWKTLEKMQEIEQFDTDKAWGSLHNRLQKNDLLANDEPHKLRSLSTNRWIAVAASIILIVGLFSVWLIVSKPFNSSNFYAENITLEPMEVNLPDGSLVYLNSQSNLSYNNKFSLSNRKVQLQGEAFFEVTRDETNPFEIFVNNASVKVLGTSFNVESSELGVKVIVKTGKVQLSTNKEFSNSIILTPGEKGSLINSILLKEKNKGENYLSWLNKRLVFKAVPLNKALVDINKAFHSNIELGDSNLNELLITTNFTNNNLDEVLKSISIAFNLRVEKTGKRHILVSN